MWKSTAALLLVVACPGIVGCAGSLRTGARDGALRGREIALSIESTPQGFLIEGRLGIAVPPDALVALTYRADLVVSLFKPEIVGVGRWPMAHDERVFLCAKAFGTHYKTWGHLRREAVLGGTRVHWKTDRGAYGDTTAVGRGRGSELTFTTFLPKKVDLARVMGRVGIALILRVLAFAARSRLEQLWRERKLPTEPPVNTKGVDVAGFAPKIPFQQGTPRERVPKELWPFVTR